MSILQVTLLTVGIVGILISLVIGWWGCHQLQRRMAIRRPKKRPDIDLDAQSFLVFQGAILVAGLIFAAAVGSLALSFATGLGTPMLFTWLSDILTPHAAQTAALRGGWRLSNMHLHPWFLDVMAASAIGWVLSIAKGFSDTADWIKTDWIRVPPVVAAFGDLVVFVGIGAYFGTGIYNPDNFTEALAAGLTWPIALGALGTTRVSDIADPILPISVLAGLAFIIGILYYTAGSYVARAAWLALGLGAIVFGLCYTHLTVREALIEEVGKGCFLTSACVEYAGLRDDCYELEVLRRFRDNYVAKLPEGPQLIKEYYKNAPAIVTHIAASKEKSHILQGVFYRIKAAVLCIEENCPADALEIYKSLYEDLMVTFGQKRG